MIGNHFPRGFRSHLRSLWLSGPRCRHGEWWRTLLVLSFWRSGYPFSWSHSVLRFMCSTGYTDTALKFARFLLMSDEYDSLSCLALLQYLGFILGLSYFSHDAISASRYVNLSSPAGRPTGWAFHAVTRASRNQSSFHTLRTTNTTPASVTTIPPHVRNSAGVCMPRST